MGFRQAAEPGERRACSTTQPGALSAGIEADGRRSVMSAARAILIAETSAIGVMLPLGMAAALVGGDLTSLGSGFGGLGFWSVTVLGGLVVVAVLAAGWLLAVSRRPLEALIVVAGPLTVLVSYVYLAHSLDPCVLGLWQQGSSTGGVPLCETVGSGIGIHRRFHLLLHSLAGIPGLILFAVGLRRSSFARRPVDLTTP